MSESRLVLDRQSLSAQIPGATFEAGLAIYRNQQIVDFTLSHVNTLEWGVSGIVRASSKGKQVFDATVVLEASAGGGITFFSGHCTCGLPDCKHSAALAIKAVFNLSQPQRTVETTAVMVAPDASNATTAGLFSDVAEDSLMPLRQAPIQRRADAASSLMAPQAMSSSASLSPLATSRRAAPSASQSSLAGPSLDLFGGHAPPATRQVPEPVSTPAEPPARAFDPNAEVLRGIKPTAHLHITAVASDSVERLGLLRATLRFGYDGVFHYALNDHNPVQIEPEAGDRRLLLHRDLPAEHAAHHALSSMGLSGDSHGRFYRPFISTAQQQAWLRWLDADFGPLKDAGFLVTAAPGLAGWIARADSLDVQMGAEPPDLATYGTDGTDGGTAYRGERRADWFRLSLGMKINGERRNILPLLPELLAQLGAASQGDPANALRAGSTLQLPAHIYLRQPDGSYWRLPCEPLRPWLQALLELMAERGTQKDGDFAGDNLRLTRLEALHMGAALHHDPKAKGAAIRPDGLDDWQGAGTLSDTVSQLANRSNLPEIAPPAGLKAELRPYQLEGLRWLQFLRAHQLGGILADDMGLGKTLQTLAHILVEKEAGRLTKPVLVIAPVSLMGNWRREAERFTPSLKTMVLQGQSRQKRQATAADMDRYDIVIAPYSLLQPDRLRWQQQAWHIVVLDEAQNIKNANSQAARIVGELNTRHRLCLSGTPMENHLGELWSLFNFLMPGFLGGQARFRALYRTPVEKYGNTEQLDRLRRRITPFMLRRAKRDVATDLPDKQESITSVELGDSQADLYEAIRLATEKTVRDALANKGLAQSQIQILDALVKLRQVCCDPRLVPVSAERPLSAAARTSQSAKLDWLMETLPEMLAEGRRVLLFSQFTSMLALIEQALEERKINWVKLTGQSQKRDEIIERFTSGEVPLFLISLKAGGVGLNLPQADTVIHYDPWWNPAVQNQATDRAHRIGQTQPLMVYKLVAQGTIEERIMALQERKAMLAEGLFSDAPVSGLIDSSTDSLFTEDDLTALLQPLGS